MRCDTSEHKAGGDRACDSLSLNPLDFYKKVNSVTTPAGNNHLHCVQHTTYDVSHDDHTTHKTIVLFDFNNLICCVWQIEQTDAIVCGY